MFALPHLLVLAFAAVFVPLFCRWAKTWDRRRLEIFLKSMAVVILFFDPLYWLWEWRNFGALDISTTLPLYICSLFWMLLPVAAFAPRGIWKQMAMASVCTVCLMGGILGLVFNTYVGLYPITHFVPVRSLLYHIIMVLVPSVLWATGAYEPKPADRLLSVLPLFALVLLCLPLHLRYGWDYCYTGGGVGTPFELVSSRLPRAVFLLLLYGGLALVVQAAFYRRLWKKASKK